jgi:hypothetical protein
LRAKWEELGFEEKGFLWEKIITPQEEELERV